ncbi:MAG: MBL fold metallo-hydrolase [Candidatus Baldrarchaeota archaeon]
MQAIKVVENLYCIEGRGFDSNIYVIIDEDRKAMLVDCGTGLYFNQLLNTLDKLNVDLKNIKCIILTHMHFDHSGGVVKLLERRSIDVLAHKIDAKYLEEGDDEYVFAWGFGAKLKPIKISAYLEEGNNINFGDFNFKVLHTPGHTKGSICLYDEEKKILLSGDTVFAGGGVGRFDLPSGSLRDLINSLERLSKIKVDKLLPGHGEIVTENGNLHIKLAIDWIKY